MQGQMRLANGDFVILVFKRIEDPRTADSFDMFVGNRVGMTPD